jgi:ABC-type hemin transport system ATPase subunit
MYNTERGYHTGCGNKSIVTVTKDQKNMAAIENYVEAIFKEHSAISYSHLVEEIMKVSKKGERTAKERLKEMKIHELITQNTDGHYVKV